MEEFWNEVDNNKDAVRFEKQTFIRSTQNNRHAYCWPKEEVLVFAAPSLLSVFDFFLAMFTHNNG